MGEGSPSRRDLYLTTHNTHKRQTPVPTGGIRTRSPGKRRAAVPAREGPQTDDALDRAATGIDCSTNMDTKYTTGL